MQRLPATTLLLCFALVPCACRKPPPTTTPAATLPAIPTWKVDVVRPPNNPGQLFAIIQFTLPPSHPKTLNEPSTNYPFMIWLRTPDTRDVPLTNLGMTTFHPTARSGPQVMIRPGTTVTVTYPLHDFFELRRNQVYYLNAMIYLDGNDSGGIMSTSHPVEIEFPGEPER